MRRCPAHRKTNRVAPKNLPKLCVHARTLPRSKRQVEARLKGFEHVPPKLRVHPRTLTKLK